MFRGEGIKLHIIISALILFIIVSTVSINWFTSMNAHKNSMTDSYLKSNYNYAKKVASSTDYQLSYMQNNIIAIGDFASQHTLSQSDLDTWYAANKDGFNDMFITNAEGILQLISPITSAHDKGEKDSKGTKLKKDAIKESVSEKKPLISIPYYGINGELITLITAPIYDKLTGKYEGLIGGTINMESANVLNSIVGNHEYDDDSYVYVVNEHGELIYHPDSSRLGEDVSINGSVQQVMNKKTGSSIITNTKGNEYFSGYSYVESTGWGVVAQTPTEIMAKALTDLFWDMVILSIPFLFFILLIGGLIVSTITKPIRRLAEFSERKMGEENESHDVKTINIRSPVYEVRQLYYQGIEHLRMLNRQAKMDGLTEIANRRMFDSIIDIWVKEKIPFALIMLDIDHFKKVNDTHGHVIGDEVIKHIAKIMVDISDPEDLCFRYGGEEFGILVKNEEEKEALELAEKLRRTVAHTINPSGNLLTISLGVTSYEQTDEHPQTILNRADTALYQSKRSGRNKTTLFNHDKSFAQS